MSKKHDLPAMPFYFGDWFKAPEIRALDLESRMIWFEMLGLMWESTERGYLTINKKPISNICLSKILGVARDLLDVCLNRMEELGVFSKREDGAIYNRRMVKDAEISQKRANSGRLGAFAKANCQQTSGKVGGKSLANTENENEDSNTKVLLLSFCDKYKEKIKRDYLINWKKEMSLAKNLLNTFSLEDLKTLIDKFFLLTDKFIQEAGYSFGVFYTQVNKLNSAGSIKKNQKEKFAPCEF